MKPKSYQVELDIIIKGVEADPLDGRPQGHVSVGFRHEIPKCLRCGVSGMVATLQKHYPDPAEFAALVAAFIAIGSNTWDDVFYDNLDKECAKHGPS